MNSRVTFWTTVGDIGWDGEDLGVVKLPVDEPSEVDLCLASYTQWRRKTCHWNKIKELSIINPNTPAITQTQYAENDKN